MSTKVTYAEVVEALSRETGFSKEKSKAFTKVLIEQILEELQENGKASITNFGSFKVKEVAEREGQNPQTGEPIIIPAHKRVSFTPYKALKEEVNAIYSHLETELIEEEPSEPASEAHPFSELEPESEPEQKEEQETEFEMVPDLDPEPEPESSFDPEPEENLDPEPKPEPKVFTPKTRPRERTKGTNTGLILVVVLALAIVAIASIWFLLSSGDEEIATTEQSAVEQSQAMTGSSAQVVGEEGGEMSEEEDAESVESANAQEVEEEPEEMAAAISESEETRVQERQTPSERSKDVDFYLVHEDEWYWVISRNTYGKAHFWPLIFRQNYTVNHHPDSLETNVRLEVPILEGSAESPTKADYLQLAAGAKIVSEAYQKFGRTDKAEEYARFARRWERAGM